MDLIAASQKARKDAERLRERARKTRNGRFLAEAAALQQLAQRIRNGVPEDPDEQDVKRLVQEIDKEKIDFSPTY